MTSFKNPISSFLVVLLNVGWWLVALAIVLTIGLAALSAFHDIAMAVRRSTSRFRSASILERFPSGHRPSASRARRSNTPARR